MKLKFSYSDDRRTVTAESSHGKYTIGQDEGSTEWTAKVEPYWQKIELSGDFPDMVKAVQHLENIFDMAAVADGAALP
jgi:hypothetical protein